MIITMEESDYYRGVRTLDITASELEKIASSWDESWKECVHPDDYFPITAEIVKAVITKEFDEEATVREKHWNSEEYYETNILDRLTDWFMDDFYEFSNWKLIDYEATWTDGLEVGED